MSPRWKMPPRPRLPFCWICSRKLYGTSHETMVVGGFERIIHKSCRAEAVAQALDMLRSM